MRHKYLLSLYWGHKVILVVSYLSYSGNHVVLTGSSGSRSRCKYLCEFRHLSKCWCGSRAAGDTS